MKNKFSTNYDKFIGNGLAIFFLCFGRYKEGSLARHVFDPISVTKKQVQKARKKTSDARQRRFLLWHTIQDILHEDKMKNAALEVATERTIKVTTLPTIIHPRTPNIYDIVAFLKSSNVTWRRKMFLHNKRRIPRRTRHCITTLNIFYRQEKRKDHISRPYWHHPSLSTQIREKIENADNRSLNNSQKKNLSFFHWRFLTVESHNTTWKRKTTQRAGKS